MRTAFPVKYYKDEGFVERKIELDDNVILPSNSGHAAK